MMEIPFRPIRIEDKEIITSFTIPSDYRNCDYSFSNICSWRFLYDSQYAVVDGNLLIRFWIENKTRIVYMAPTGTGDMKQALDLLEADSIRHGHPLRMLGVTPDAQKVLEKTLPGGFVYIPDRNYFDYIYLREDLATLRGKKYQSKRNHINNFKKQYAYEYMNITPDIVPQCLKLEQKWYNANNTIEDKGELSYERRSLTYALNHFDKLGLRGGAICIDNKIVAFTFGAPINHNTFGIHVEKADINYDGAFALINQEFASRLPEEYIYLNREEDLGIAGLRQSKLSYHPLILLEKYVVVKKPQQKK